jgi:hypothetical protein
MKKLLFLAAFAALMGACKREGCTDADATNFDDKAKKNVGCAYQGSAVFWYSKTTSDNLVADDAVALTYYVDGQIVGSSAANTYWTGAPNCDQSGTVAFSRDLGGQKSKDFAYVVKDQTGHEYFKGTVTLSGNTCNQVQLVF